MSMSGRLLTSNAAVGNKTVKPPVEIPNHTIDNGFHVLIYRDIDRIRTA